MTRYDSIPLFILRPHAKSSHEALRARPKSLRLIEDRHFACCHLVQQDGNEETCPRRRLVHVYMPVLIQPHGFHDPKLLHPCERSLPQEGSFRLGSSSDQLGQIIRLLSGEADRFGEPFCGLGRARFSRYDCSPFSTMLGQCGEGFTGSLHHMLAGIRRNAVQPMPDNSERDGQRYPWVLYMCMVNKRSISVKVDIVLRSQVLETSQSRHVPLCCSNSLFWPFVGRYDMLLHMRGEHYHGQYITDTALLGKSKTCDEQWSSVVSLDLPLPGCCGVRTKIP